MLGYTEETSLFGLLLIVGCTGIHFCIFISVAYIYLNKRQEMRMTCPYQSYHDLCTMTKQSNQLFLKVMFE